jgi:AraC-like DNA-binding protein
VEQVAEAVTGVPSGVLGPWVDRYRAYRYEGFAPGLHTGMPSPGLTFIISLGDPVDIACMPGGRQPPAALQAFVGGLHSTPALIAHDGNQVGVSIDLTPLGARALFGMPAGELAWHVVDLADVLGPEGRSLADRLVSCDGWAPRFAALDEVLARAIARRRGQRRRHATDPPPEVTEAFRRLVVSGGRIPISTLASEVGWSRRHLGQRFREEVGLSPKAAARVIRFDRAKRLLAAGDRGLAEVAAVTGYADQAHFSREFRELAGTTPTAWMAEELPFVQDGDPFEPAG